MERFLWKGHIFPGRLDEYKQKHDDIWPEMIEMMHSAGLRNYSIWNNGSEVIGYYEFDGMGKKQQIYCKQQQLVDRWNAHMQGIMEMDKDETGAVLTYRQVFLME